MPVAFSINEDSYFYKTGDVDDKAKYSSKSDNISLTYYSFGITYEYYGLNIGGFMGWDRMFGSQKDWIYQKKPWVSVGIGYKFGGAD